MYKETKEPLPLPMMPIENFSEMQSRYQMLPLANRASAVISDARPAISAAEKILNNLASHAKLDKAITNLRNNSLLTSRIRSSEAKSALMDSSIDFIQMASGKITAWSRTLQHIASGKTKATLIKDNVPEHLSLVGVSSYLPLIKLVIIELSKLDKDNEAGYEAMLSEIRRATTILSDCECASELNNVVLH
jgi:hypothetical protein